MPRRKRQFIDRNRSTTVQLVRNLDDHTSASNVLTSASNSSQVESQPQNSASLEPNSKYPYKHADFELGEYGFPEDGYDYSKHFRTIGGGGGVFMNAATGMPDPDAVSLRAPVETPKHSKIDEIRLRDDLNKLQLTSSEPTQSHVNSATPAWKIPEDNINKSRAIKQIKHDRKIHSDLDEVFVHLDGDNDLTSASSEDEKIPPAPTRSIDTDEQPSTLFEDDFILLANADTEDQPQPQEKNKKSWENIVEKFREPRLLDQHFEKFMSGFQLDDTDEELEEIEAQLLDISERCNSNPPHVPSEQFEGPWEDDTVAEGMPALNFDSSNMEEYQPDIDPQFIEDQGSKSDTSTSRKKEYEEYKSAEFERGMTHLLDSYVRITPEETFKAFEGTDKVREAVLRNEKEEKARIANMETSNTREEDETSELDAVFENMFEQREQWDCESILSTYTNLENHPSVIDAPVGHRKSSSRRILNRKTVSQSSSQEDSAEPLQSAGTDSAMDYGSRRETVPVAIRTRGETNEEKKVRKAVVKEAARERRALKSEMKKAFSMEHSKQVKHAASMGKAKVAVKF